MLRTGGRPHGHAGHQLCRLGGDHDQFAEQHGADQCLGDPGSTGLFWWYISYGIQNVTDGTSNTVAFSEALVSNRRVECGRRRADSIIRETPCTGIGGAGGAAQQYDANQNPAGVLAGLKACTTAPGTHKRVSTTFAGSSGRSARSG